jgi:hypothetical protein
MENNNKKKFEQLGEPIGTAVHKLRKSILYKFVQILELDICYRCGEKITEIDNFSIEHKIPWQNSDTPRELFYDLDNIAFSHLDCNTKARRAKTGRNTVHGTTTAYRYGCRCDDCKKVSAVYRQKHRSKLKLL